MPAIHVRNVPEAVLASLRERAYRNGRSMQEEIRLILHDAATDRRRADHREPISLRTVRTAGRATWSREEIYGDAGR